MNHNESPTVKKVVALIDLGGSGKGQSHTSLENHSQNYWKEKPIIRVHTGMLFNNAEVIFEQIVMLLILWKKVRKQCYVGVPTMEYHGKTVSKQSFLRQTSFNFANIQCK